MPLFRMVFELFFSYIEKSESIMNQENAPHMQPMEQMGTPPAQDAEGNAAWANAPQAQPIQAPAPAPGYPQQGQFAPYPNQGSSAAMPYQSFPYNGMGYGAYPQQMAYPTQQAAAYPPAIQPAYQQQVQAAEQQENGTEPMPQAPMQPVQQIGQPAQNAGLSPQSMQQPMPQAFQAQQPMQAYPQVGAVPQQVQIPQAPTVQGQAAYTRQQPAFSTPFVPSFVEEASYDESFAHTMNGGTLEEDAAEQPPQAFDYHYINSPARIAIYDSLKTAPRVIQVQGGPTHEYIEHIASLTYKNAKEAGGMIPYTVIREVSENFIHAKFNEVVVSIFDQGNTIRFADQGPGIKHKDLVQEPGFSSAIEPMKRYIRGVGSGLPIVKDYLSTSHGHIEIKDNVNQGSVVTISLVASRTPDEEIEALETPELTENEIAVLKALLPNNTLGVSEVSKATGIAVASVHTAFSKMEEAGLVEKVSKKRKLTGRGTQVALSL